MTDDNANTAPEVKISDPLSAALGINPMAPEMTQSGRFIIPEPNDDYEYGRSNLIDLIEKGNQVLAEFSQISAAAQSPRHYEVLTNMINSLIEANEKLMTMKKHDIEIKNAEKLQKEPNQTVTNNLFVGSTAEVQKMLETAIKSKNAN